MNGTIVSVCLPLRKIQCFLAAISNQSTNPRLCRRGIKKENPEKRNEWWQTSKPMMSLESKTANRSPTLYSSANTNFEFRPFRHWETSCEKDKLMQWNKVDPSQFSDLQCYPSRESLFECTTEIDSLCRRRSAGRRGQWDDLGYLYVSKRWRRPFISDKITIRICVQPITQTPSRSKHCSMSRILWSRITKVKSTGYLRTNGIQLHGWERLGYMTEQSSCPKQRYTSTLILCCLEKSHEHPTSIQKWKDQIGWLMDSKDYQEIERNRRRAGRVRVEYFPRTRNTGSAPWNSKKDGRKQNKTWQIRRSNHLHVYVSWHRLVERRKNFTECVSSSVEVKAYPHRFPEGTLVCPRTSTRRDVAWNAHLQARRFVEPICRDDNASCRRMRTPSMSSNKCVAPRIFEKHEKVESYRFTAMVFCRMQSCCFAQSFPSTGSGSTERSRIGVENWLSNSQFIRFPAQGNP